jgi:hypothetical protein
MAAICRRYVRSFLYLADMAQAPFSPPPGQPRGDGGEHTAGQPPPVERYGELEIERHVKDDGRALILYTHRRERPIADGST